MPPLKPLAAASAPSPALTAMTEWSSLLAAWRAAARSKRATRSVAAFEHRLADRLLRLQAALRAGRWHPGPYRHFLVHEPKRRRISAAPFVDRIVHHALCTVIEPRFERGFIADSYANRRGKGTHAAIRRFRALARRFPFVLRLDVVQHFPAIDHEILLGLLARRIPEPDLMALITRIVDSGAGVLDGEYTMQWFPGDDLTSIIKVTLAR